MFFPLLLLFTCVPIVELALLIKLGQATGVWTAVAIVLATGIAGAALARHEGFKTWMAIQNKMNAGQVPSDDMIEGLMILIAGLMLVTPGLLTDALGFAFLIPPVRRLLRRRLATWFGRHMVIVTHQPPQGAPYDIVDEQDATEANAQHDKLPPPR